MMTIMQKADPKTKDLLNAAETISCFDLSRRKFYKMMSEKSDKSFVVMYGSRKLIIRTEFEKYLLDHPELRRCR